MIAKKILIVSQTHLCRNPRVLKEALTLSNYGYKVKILTSIHSKQLLLEDKDLLSNTQIEYEFYMDLSKKNLESFLSRIKLKIFKLLQLRARIESKHSLGYGYTKMKRQCINEKAALYIMHQEMPLVLGVELIPLGFKIAFDLEDYYSEDLHLEARKSRPLALLRKSEKLALNKGIYVLTTSNALSEHFKNEYGGNKAFVIRNVFDLNDDILISKIKSPVKLYWFSQTTGPGRGLELLIEATNFISSNLQIHLRGNVNEKYKNELLTKLNSRHQLFFHNLLPNHLITKDMENYDIGLALETNEPLSKLLTTSNKIFHYLVGGLAVIASDTNGQVEVANLQSKEAILIFKNYDPKSLADKINYLISNITLLQSYKENALWLGQNQFNWEIEQKKLLSIVNEKIKI